MAKKIFAQNNSTIIEGVGIYPKGSLFAAETGGTRFVFSTRSSKIPEFIEFASDWSDIEDESGSGFASFSDTKDYLTTVL